MLPLGFIIFPLLINLLNEQKNNDSILSFFIYGFIYGIGFLTIFLSWIYNPFLIYDTTKDYVILGIFLPIFLSLFFGLFFCIYRYLKNYLLILLLTPFVFLLIELVISNSFYKFPWLSFSLILSNNFIGFIILKYFGIYISSYLILFIFILPSLFILKNNFNSIKITIIILHLPFIITPVMLDYYSNFNESKIKKELNLDVYQLSSQIKNPNREEILENIINIIDNSNAELIIFGENNYPYIINDDDISYLNKSIINDKKIIIGATRQNKKNFYNSFFFLEQDNFQYFDKKFLVPFGEFLPFRKYLNFMEIIVGGEDFMRGTKDRLITTNDNINILPIICYEIIFNQTYKNLKQNEIDILVNITNDAWFGTKIGPYQHFYLSRIRSLVSNRPLIRVSNNGISAVIDEKGKIINHTKLNQKTNFKNKLIISTNNNWNLNHNLFLIYLVLLFLITLVVNTSRINNEK